VQKGVGVGLHRRGETLHWGRPAARRLSSISTLFISAALVEASLILTF
jgi:hypothetical protein